MKIAVLVGSLRSDSYSRKLLGILSHFSAGMTLEEAEIGDLPLYNEDLETEFPPASYVRFRKNILGADAVLFITPEYNRSIPAVLKNAIDVGSRPFGQTVWDGKPGAVISLSQGSIGGFGANHHLRQTLVFNNLLMLQQPEAYIGHIQNLITDNGQIIDPQMKQFLDKFMDAFKKWIKKIQG